MLSLLARSARLLRGQQQRGGRVGQKEVLADAGGLLRVLAPQEGGPYSNQTPDHHHSNLQETLHTMLHVEGGD